MTSLTSGGFQPPLVLPEGDTIDFVFRWSNSGTLYTPPVTPVWIFGIKDATTPSGDFLVQVNSASANAGVYTFTVPISSAELQAWLATATSQSYAAIQITDTANGIATTPLLCQITANQNDSGTTPTGANGTLNVAAGKTVTFPLTLTFPSAAGTNGYKLTLDNATTGALTWTADNAGAPGGSNTQVQYNNNGAFGGYAISGTGSVAMTDSPTFTGTIGGAEINITGTIVADVCYGSNGIEIGSNSSYTFDDSIAANFLYLQAPAGLFGTDKTQTLQNASGTIALTSDITGGTREGSFTTLAGTSSATLGTNGGTGGSVVLRGSTSGSATINTSNTGVLALPSGTTATSMALTTPALGVATATSVQVGNGTSSVTSLQIGNNALNGFYSPSLVGTDIGVSANGTWVAFWNSSWGLVARLPIIPLSNNGTSCGTSGLRWSGVYSVLGDFSGAVVCGTTLAVTGATTLTGLLTANGGITLGDAQNIAFNTTTGTKIGAATTQKLSFWNATPIVQPTTAVASATVVHTGGGTNIKTDDTFDGYTIAQVVKALRNAGLLA